MPINIYEWESRKPIVHLCDDEWVLIKQFEYFKEWVYSNREKFTGIACNADIGFCWNKDAKSGGPAFDIEFMKLLIELNVTVFISEYPGFTNE